MRKRIIDKNGNRVYCDCSELIGTAMCLASDLERTVEWGEKQLPKLSWASLLRPELGRARPIAWGLRTTSRTARSVPTALPNLQASLERDIAAARAWKARWSAIANAVITRSPQPPAILVGARKGGIA